MACYHPIPAWQLESGDIVFSERGKVKRSLMLPCGQCIGCRLERSRQWAVRCMHESVMHDCNSFVTLTYNAECIPSDFALNYRHFQLFMKRLRRFFVGTTIRFYMCGEYGETYSRPHFHACLFGCHFKDRYPWRQSGAGFQLYRSDVLESLWTFGSAEIGDVTFESAAYCARYIMKKVTGPRALEYYEMVDPETGEIYCRAPEFTRMSLKPGIGFSWYEKFKSEVFPLDRVVVRGRECRPPRYYKILLDSEPGYMSDMVEYDRYIKSIALCADNTEERLRVKEDVCRARIKNLHRSVE